MKERNKGWEEARIEWKGGREGRRKGRKEGSDGRKKGKQNEGQTGWGRS